MQLLELVRDYDDALEQDERTINVHISHIRDKIEPERSGNLLLEELAERAFEANLVLDRLHLAPEPCNLPQSEIVDRVGGERQGRVLLDQITVELGPAFHVDEPHALARVREIFVLQKVP